MPSLYQKVQLKLQYPEPNCFILFHGNGQEFRSFENNEKIVDFLDWNRSSFPVKVFLAEQGAGIFSSNVKIVSKVEPMNMIVGTKNFFQVHKVTKEKRKYELMRKNPFQVSIFE